ncbi:uncharacterized protein DUF4112 [Arcticibacter tournemirensis]|uniref:DUF4112 domain-containing protein n=1 Tax=Arcticibacter tournemirensis TaxID=699437 RepID=A0A5M9HIK7_9SPHI|nr:DUF4112 domain-containing protein [Arcticibacter tournemirensis]KAA8486339.1 DUF4112 domain-containing protein [Arcticibacter tournemirensis]TQM52155.1 uncharacterized protein DUF4112 [Arcticibacter tournemirensis]
MSNEISKPVELNNQKLKWVERVAYLMDNQFRLPGTSFRFGVDPIVNFIPFLGDISAFLVSAVLVLTMARHGASGKVLILMVLNILLDAVIGAIPVIGWIFDFGYKANSRNINLLKRHYVEGKYQGSGKGIIFTIIVVILVFFIVLIYLMWKILAWAADMI